MGRHFNRMFICMVCLYDPQIVDTDLMTSLMTSSYNNLSRHYNTMFPYTVCLYILHVPFGVKVNTFSPASERTMSPTGLSRPNSSSVQLSIRSYSHTNSRISWLFCIIHDVMTHKLLQLGPDVQNHRRAVGGSTTGS